jgi:hypothetical protein
MMVDVVKGAPIANLAGEVIYRMYATGNPRNGGWIGQVAMPDIYLPGKPIRRTWLTAGKNSYSLAFSHEMFDKHSADKPARTSDQDIG